MWKLRKFLLRRSYYCTLVLLFVGCPLVVYMLSGPKEYGDNKFKIQLIEESIKSYVNQGECKIPDLPIDNPEVMQFYTNDEKLDCGRSEDDWVRCEKSICFVKAEVIAKKGEITCTYTDLVRKTDYKVKYGKTTKTREHYVLQESDFAKVFCRAPSGERWFGLVIGIRDTVARPIEHSIYPLYNVLMIGFDSLSRNAFIRKLPKTYKFLTEDLQGNVLKGYNIVGDGTPQALIPILTGHTELELPETRKRMANSGYVNAYPMIWKDYEKHGYVTSFNEDIPTYGTFTYRMNGFKQQPTDHYMRTFYLEVENYLSSYGKHCIGNQAAHQVLLDYTRNFMTKYSENPRFVFSFHGDLSHDSINLIGVADDDILRWLQALKRKNILDDTILIVMSDHGNRFADVRNTLQGKQEERLPFFSFSLPDSFKKRYSQEYRNLVNNVYRLTTPFDVHETLKDILRLQSLESWARNPSNSRAVSLFSEIPKNRSCADAYIEPHWCACLNWKPVNSSTAPIVRRIAASILDTINNYTLTYRSICESLSLLEINWTTKLAPHTELLKFKQNKDFDGFIADLSAPMHTNQELYQMKLTVSPGKSVFEASVSHDLGSDKLVTNLAQISRINKYGNQADCIYDRNPELRKYCYCRSSVT